MIDRLYNAEGYYIWMFQYDTLCCRNDKKLVMVISIKRHGHAIFLIRPTFGDQHFFWYIAVVKQTPMLVYHTKQSTS